MLEEDKPKADVVLRRAARKLVRQQLYDAKHTTIAHIFAEKGKRISKAQNVKKMPEMSKEDFYSVSNCPWDSKLVLICNCIICSSNEMF